MLQMKGTKVMMIDNKGVDFSHIPAFAEIIEETNVRTAKKMMDKITEIKYMLCILTYLDESCEKIYEIGKRIDNTYMEMLSNDNISSAKGVVNAVDTLFVMISTKLKNLLYSKMLLFYNRHPGFCTSEENTILSENEIYEKIVQHWLDWDEISNKNYNEIPNPDTITTLLSKLFTVTDETRTMKYYVSMYDFNNYNVPFKDINSVEIFCNNFVDVGEVFERMNAAKSDETPVWTSLYSCCSRS